MNISDMHVWFRQYAQQMGMQNVRAILPEQIDILINTSITDTVNQIIRENVGITNDRVITDNSKIGQINALKHLYKVNSIPFVTNGRKLLFNGVVLREYIPDETTLENEPITGIPDYSKIKFTILDESYISHFSSSQLSDADILEIKNYYKTKGIIIDELNIGLYSSSGTYHGNVVIGGTIVIKNNSDADLNNVYFEFVDNENNPLTTYYKNEQTEPNISVNDAVVYNFDFENKNHYNGLVSLRDNLQDYLFLVDFSIDYADAAIGIGKSIEYLNNFITNLFPIRLIDDAYLADTLNDFVLRPRLRSPIAVIVNNKLQIYLGKLSGDTTNGYFLDNNLVPNNVRIAYIAKPAKVSYSEDINGQNVDCDLPDYMHVDILKHAVDLYRAAISGGIAASQASEQAQNQENVRNNYRNEGYQ